MSMKKITEQKLQAFAIGAMGIKRSLSRKEQEDLRKKEEDELAAHVFQEFVETFQETPTASSKVWVKAGTYDAGSRKEDNREKGKLYRPGSKSSDDKTSADKAQDYAKMLANEAKKESITLKKKTQEKKKSNLELFKEELRQIQEEREERHKYKHMTKHVPQSSHDVESTKEATETGSFDNGDPNTTNLYLGNLNPKISEQQLMELFGKYGPLASIKIMWPRSEEERSRGRNCGFVAYMSRKDAERALKSLNGRDIMGYEMRLGWGKSVPILSFPIYVPPELLEYTMPPPPSGLPFNAQPAVSDVNSVPGGNYKEYVEDIEKKNQMEKILFNSVVKVVVPNEKPLLCLIHRMIEFVIREGPMFEAMVMSKEMENPMFTFLFDNESPAHLYYRWKLFSLLQGDSPTEWKEKEFRMFKGGSIWKPPAVNFYLQGMPEELIEEEEGCEMNKGALSHAQRDRLEDLIRYLTPEKGKIGDAMIFCIEHAEAADEICECIAESLSNPTTLMSKKIARLYLISDILHNCTVKVSNASFFRKSMEKNLIEVFRDIHSYYMGIESRLKGEEFKSRVINVISAWEDWTVYPKEFLSNLKSVFLGKQNVEKLEVDCAPVSGDEKEDEELDGIPLDGAALLKSAMLHGLQQETVKTATPPRIQELNHDFEYDEDDIDGVPLEEDIDGVPLEDLKNKGGFIPSKWETVDPEQVEAQAITTSKWDTLDPIAPEPPKFYDSDEKSEDTMEKLDEDKRTKLREIEVKIMQYQDELESGQRELKGGWTLAQQLDHYRRKLLKKEQKGIRDDAYDSPKILKRSPSPSESIASKKSKRSKRSPSRYSSERGLSPVTRNKRRSRSPYPTKYREVSPVLQNRSSKAKRNKSRSESISPKRYREKSPNETYLKSTKYDVSSPHNQRSPSPSRSSLSRKSHVTEYRRESPSKYKNASPSRYKSERHKHKHKR